MAPLRSLGNPDISPFDDVFAATGKRYNHYFSQGAGAATRGLFGGSYPNNNTIDYITVASAGNATDFGNLSRGVHQERAHA